MQAAAILGPRVCGSADPRLSLSCGLPCHGQTPAGIGGELPGSAFHLLLSGRRQPGFCETGNSAVNLSLLLWLGQG